MLVLRFPLRQERRISATSSILSLLEPFVSFGLLLFSWSIRSLEISLWI
jgi:hypothetical protein